MTFMGAPYGRPGPANKAAILGIPFDCGTNMRIGARGGPDSVRQQSALMRRFNPPTPTSIRWRRWAWSIAATSS